MSIWCTILDFSADDHDHCCARWVECDEDTAKQASMWSGNRSWRYDADRPCTCDAGPIAYQKSHVVPEPPHPRAGRFDLGSIAPHIASQDVRYDEPRDEDGTHLPYLRVALQGAEDEPDVVVLDFAQVAKLHDTLGWWLGNCDPEVAP